MLVDQVAHDHAVHSVVWGRERRWEVVSIAICIHMDCRWSVIAHPSWSEGCQLIYCPFHIYWGPWV